MCKFWHVIDMYLQFTKTNVTKANPGSRSVRDPLLPGTAGLNPAEVNICLSVVNVVFREIEGSGTSRSLFQRSPTVCVCVTEYDQVQQTPIHLQ